ncbi:MAG: zinc ribbon-containing protein [Bacteroidota bacterium]
MNKKPNINLKQMVMFTSGDKPGKGKYKCKKCGKEITLENDSQELPRCPKCGHDKWDKIE